MTPSFQKTALPLIAVLILGSLGVRAPASENLRNCVTRLSHENPKVRSTAAFALGLQGIGAVSAIPRLKSLLGDSDPSVRKWAAWAIEQIEDELKPAPPNGISIVGDYVGDSGELAVQIGPHRQHTGLTVSGGVTLGGMLSVQLEQHDPKAGEKREIISNAASITGKFTEVQLPALPKGLRWKLIYDDIANGKDLDGDGRYDVTLAVEDNASD
jgi:hypothetical protein